MEVKHEKSSNEKVLRAFSTGKGNFLKLREMAQVHMQVKRTSQFHSLTNVHQAFSFISAFGVFFQCRW